ncbi:MAG: HAMP domain-containing protein [Clostridia bacterium]|jgi:two-component system sensor histidine kinase ArlS|nr:HAMP domain-containing protein [Clostridia bacterium]
MATENARETAEESKKEAVDETIREVLAEQAPPPQKRAWWQTTLMIVFFPFTGLIALYRFITSHLHLRISVKTTVIFTLMFGVVLAAFVIFVISSISNQLSGDTIDTDRYLATLKLTSAILVVLFIIIGAVVGGIASQTMLNPVRRMIDTIDSIDGNNLSRRLDAGESKDELADLTGRINSMLDDIELTFDRQSNFVSDASHELKTPLSVIQGYANLLRRWGKDDPEILNEGIENIAREADNMKRIVEQLLLLAKLGNFSMAKMRFDLSQAVGEVVDSYLVTDIRHKLTFEGDEGITVEADKNMLVESIRTLIDNAVKYTPPENGVICVSCKRVDAHAEITVADNGIGISEADLPRIFDRFYRCDKVRGREKGSSGLGLTIAKNIIEIMGGAIEVQSKVGVGTTFVIKLY